MDSWLAWVRWLAALIVLALIHRYFWWPVDTIAWILREPQLLLRNVAIFNFLTLLGSFLFVWCPVCAAPRFKLAIAFFLGLFPLNVPYDLLSLFGVVGQHHSRLGVSLYVPTSWWYVTGVLIAWALIGWGYLRRRQAGLPSRATVG